MTEDEAVTRLAAAMNCPSKDGANCTACHANARRVIDALRSDPVLHVAVMGYDEDIVADGWAAFRHREALQGIADQYDPDLCTCHAARDIAWEALK